MTLLIIFLALGLLLNVIGFIGCFIPVLPGPTLNLIAIFILQFVIKPAPFTLLQISIFSILTVVVLVLDNFLPMITAKAYGSSLKGTVGAGVGLLTGVFFLPPIGMVVGAFIGAFIGEIISRKDKKEALKAGLATMFGFVLGAGSKLAVSGILAFYFIKAIIV